LKIRTGFDIAFSCSLEVPMLLMLSIHPSRQHDVLTNSALKFSPNVRARDFHDVFGNVCTRLVAPPGLIEIRSDFIVADSGQPDDVAPGAKQCELDDLPKEALIYLLGSRYCDTQRLSDQAWQMFGNIAGGWQRVQAICDYVHDRLEFGYHHARNDRTASEGHEEQIGVCRDFAHRGVSRRSLVHVRRSAQPSPYWSYPNRSWTGCRRRRDFDNVWPGGVGTILCCNRRGCRK
jgi:transglutaminase-like putative cysteine protease